MLRRETLAGRELDGLRRILERDVETTWYASDHVRTDWIERELARRCEQHELGELDQMLAYLAAWPDRNAREEYWSLMKAGRYYWIMSCPDWGMMTLGRRLETLPAWMDIMESNCCMLSGNVEGVFEDGFDIDALYNSASSGIGQSPAVRAYQWFELYGGEMEYSPLVNRFVARPE
jgi:hypothetical protein